MEPLSLGAVVYIIIIFFILFIKSEIVLTIVLPKYRYIIAYIYNVPLLAINDYDVPLRHGFLPVVLQQ